MTLPKTTESISLLHAKQDAVDTVDYLIKRNMELEEIHNLLQPLLFALSVRLYKDNDEPISLSKLVEDAVAWISPTETIQ